MFGHGLIVGGAVGMTGAVAIAGMSCLRAGVGLLTLAIPEKSLGIVASFDPCFMTLPLPCNEQGRLSDDAFKTLQLKLQSSTCIAIGPGLGRSEASDKIVISLFEQSSVPVIADADALNALSESVDWRNLSCGGNRILTPHPGEWHRLCGVPANDRDAQVEAANRIASQTGHVIILKGSKTWVTDGKNGYENTTGNPSMATGGSGDCLTGILTALVCQGMNCMNAAILSVFLHGRAGDLAHQELGTPSSQPTDIVRYLPDAFRSLNRTT